VAGLQARHRAGEQLNRRAGDKGWRHANRPKHELRLCLLTCGLLIPFLLIESPTPTTEASQLEQELQGIAPGQGLCGAVSFLRILRSSGEQMAAMFEKNAGYPIPPAAGD